MEFQEYMSRFLAIATVILMVASVAAPISVLVMRAAGEGFKRRTGLFRVLPRDIAFHRVDGLSHRSWFHRPRTITGPAKPSFERQRRRAHKRLRTCLMGSLHTEAVTRVDNLCDVVDFSAGGTRVRLVDPMAEISRITLGLRHFGFFPARVVWRDGEELGLKFDLAPETVVGQMRGLLSKAALAGAY